VRSSVLFRADLFVFYRVGTIRSSTGGTEAIHSISNVFEAELTDLRAI